jgi:hypothetical protein
MRTVRASCVIIAVALAMPALLVAQGPRQQRVAFTPGSSSAVVSGTLKGEDTIDYVLGAAEGQSMRIVFKPGTPSASFNVLPPGSEAAIAIGATVGNTWIGTLPVKGDYRVRVFLVRSVARRGGSASFTLEIGITGRPDAMVKGTPYHATGAVACSFGPDPEGSARCSFGVIRSGNGKAEVHLASPGYDVAIHKDRLRILRFDGRAVTSGTASEKVSVTRQGDDWLVSVDGLFQYTIPDAVIVGG